MFSEGLARNTGKLDGIVAGLESMTGGGTPAPQKITYDLRSAGRILGPAGKTLKASLAIPEPTAVAMLETQRFLFQPPGDHPEFAEAMWADSIPKLLQARLIEGFENYDLAHAPLRNADLGQAEYQLLIDVRRFRIDVECEPAAQIGLSVKHRRQERKGRRIAPVRGERKARQARSGGGGRRVQCGLRPNGKGHHRLDRAGAVGVQADERPRTGGRYSSVFRYDSRSWI